MTKHPYAATRLAQFLSKRIDALRGTRNQAEIAKIVGYKTPNVITMLKTGATKLPIDRVPSMARALEVDPAMLLRLTFEQAFNETTARAVDEIFGTPVSANERGWVDAIRDA